MGDLDIVSAFTTGAGGEFVRSNPIETHVVIDITVYKEA